jgi:GNAT superfamily N-acetyltransferase
MDIIDLSPEYHSLYFLCLEEWSSEIREAGDHKAAWFRKMQGKGLGVKLARDEAGTVGGMIQFLPVEHSTVEGKGLYFIPCTWVHGYKQGRGNFQKQGMGSALLEAAEAEAKSRGALGMAAWGLRLPFWMKASWYRKHGYRLADSMGMMGLVWKPFTPEAQPPRWIRPKKKPEIQPGMVTVTALLHGWCPAYNMSFERARRAAAEFGDKVVFRAVDTFDREAILEWGRADALFIDGREVRTGPPPSYEKIRKLIARQVGRLK